MNIRTIMQELRRIYPSYEFKKKGEFVYRRKRDYPRLYNKNRNISGWRLYANIGEAEYIVINEC